MHLIINKLIICISSKFVTLITVNWLPIRFLRWTSKERLLSASSLIHEETASRHFLCSYPFDCFCFSRSCLEGIQPIVLAWSFQLLGNLQTAENAVSTFWTSDTLLIFKLLWFEYVLHIFNKIHLMPFWGIALAMSATSDTILSFVIEWLLY